MLRSVLLSLIAAALCLGAMGLRQEKPPVLAGPDIKMMGASVFGPGERLKYRVHYGFLNAGEAWLVINNNIKTENDRPCYQIEVQGRSVGAFDKLTRIRNTWGTCIDTGYMKPQRAYRDIHENKYRLEENLDFDYGKRVVNVKVKERKDTAFKIPPAVYDIVSGYYFLRQIDYSRTPIGSVIVLDAFFDNEQYKFKVRYVGKETIKTKYGRAQALVISPIMPENSFFDGENSIRLWMSDDANRVPLKLSAELFVGSVDLDLSDFGGTKTGLTFSRR